MVREWQRGYEIANEFMLEEARNRSVADRMRGLDRLRSYIRSLEKLAPTPHEESFIYAWTKVRGKIWEAMIQSDRP